jgi:hypothetical protein
MGHLVFFFFFFFLIILFLKKFNLKLRVNLKFYKKIRGINIIVSLLTFKIGKTSL